MLFVKNSKLSVPKESGAMNEAFSDIWGLYRYYAAPGKSTWLMEDIERRAGSLALRSMSDPKSEDNQILMEVQTGKQSNVALPHKQMTTAGYTQTAVS
jgi:Zn-dependent metalloprotease